jgi:hypothetical protein
MRSPVLFLTFATAIFRGVTPGTGAQSISSLALVGSALSARRGTSRLSFHVDLGSSVRKVVGPEGV